MSVFTCCSPKKRHFPLVLTSFPVCSFFLIFKDTLPRVLGEQWLVRSPGLISGVSRVPMFSGVYGRCHILELVLQFLLVGLWYACCMLYVVCRSQCDLVVQKQSLVQPGNFLSVACYTSGGWWGGGVSACLWEYCLGLS